MVKLLRYENVLKSFFIQSLLLVMDIVAELFGIETPFLNIIPLRYIKLGTT